MHIINMILQNNFNKEFIYTNLTFFSKTICLILLFLVLLFFLSLQLNYLLFTLFIYVLVVLFFSFLFFILFNQLYISISLIFLSIGAVLMLFLFTIYMNPEMLYYDMKNKSLFIWKKENNLKIKTLMFLFILSYFIINYMEPLLTFLMYHELLYSWENVEDKKWYCLNDILNKYEIRVWWKDMYMLFHFNETLVFLGIFILFVIYLSIKIARYNQVKLSKKIIISKKRF